MARKERRKVGAGRYQQQHDTRDSSGSDRQQALDFTKVKGGAEFFKIVAGTHKFNIIPFEIKSKLHPMVHKKKMNVGDLDFVLDVWIHQFVGPAGADVFCPKKNYGKSCPLCDEVSRLYDAKQDSAAKDISASRRVFYNVQLFGKDGLEEGTKVLHASHYLFAKELMEEANECGQGGTVIPFADLDEGTLVKFRASEEALGENTMIKCKSFSFPAREEEVPDELVDNAVSFDELIQVLTPDQIEAIMMGEDDDGAGVEEETTPAQEMAEENASDDEPVDEEPPPRTRRRRPEPEKEPEGEKEDNPCPKGYVFGTDCDTKTACSSCPDKTYDACAKKAGI